MEYGGKKDKYNNQRSATVIIVAFVLLGGICYYAKGEVVSRIAAFAFILILFILLFSFDTEDKRIIKATKGKCKTTRTLIRELSHISYFYGLFFFSIKTCIFIEIIVYSIVEIVFGKFVMVNIVILWMTTMKLVGVNENKISLVCHEECKSDQCNFLCKWFAKKNEYLFVELASLREYLNSVPDRYFESEIEVIVDSRNKNFLSENSLLC